MNIVLLFNEFALHNQIVERFVEARPNDNVSLVKVPLVIKGKSRFDSAHSVLPKLPKRFVAGKLLEFASLLALTWSPKLLPKGAVFRRLSRIASRHRIPFRQVDNVMSPESIEFIRSCEPDWIISLFHQIVKPPLISIPKGGFVNIHPGVLPEFRGIQPYFWQLARGASHSGATFHLIEDAGIDTGRVLARVRYPNVPGMSVQLNYFLTCQAVAATLPMLVEKLEQGVLEPLTQTEEGGYYRWPDSAAFDELRRRGHSMIGLADLWNILSGRYDHFAPTEVSWATGGTLTS